MKNYFLKVFIICLCCLCLYSCKQEDTICACGVKNPAKKLPWLKDVIKRSKADNADYLLNCIWLEKYKGQDIFVVLMSPSDPRMLYRYFDCSGNVIVSKYNETAYNPFFKENPYAFSTVEDEEFFFTDFVFHWKKDILVYCGSFPCN